MTEDESEEQRDANRSIRHAVRTYLNHLAGYGEVLREEAAEAGLEDLKTHYDSITQSGFSLRDVVIPCFRTADEGGPNPTERQGLEREAYGILYDIIARIQTIKRLVTRDDRFLADTEKILDAANAIVGLLEDGLKTEPAQEPTRPRPSLDEVTLPPATRTGRILIVDDDFFNRELLSRHLERQGHVVCVASDGIQALSLLRDASFDVLILDVMMPGMNGYQLLESLKSETALASLYVIVISSLDDTQSIARCIQLGAEDYLPREFEPIILRARIESCLEKKELKEKESLYVAAVRETERRLRAELQEGATYVRSLLPPQIEKPDFSTDWVFIPSLSLGGDVFGYHPICGVRGDRRLALYLIDVSGHGIEAALFSVTLMNLLKNQALPATDFGDPASVLTRLNESFRMEEQNNLYFTAWYGVWDPTKRELSYSSAGAPPALLLEAEGREVSLATEGMIIGLEEGAQYQNEQILIRPGSNLYLFSDGAYEVRLQDGSVLGIDAFAHILAEGAKKGIHPLLAPLVEKIRALSPSGRFEDDVSIVEFRFG